MKAIIGLTILLPLVLMTKLGHASGPVVIGTGGKTGTRISIVDDSNYRGMCLKEGLIQIGTLQVIGEVPSTVLLSDDSVARQLVHNIGRLIVKERCPKFKFSGLDDLEIRLYYDRYTEWNHEPAVIAKYVVRDRKVTLDYKNEAREVEERRALGGKDQAVIASSEIHSLPYNDFLFILKTDPVTGAKFWTKSTNRSAPCAQSELFNTVGPVYVEIPRRVSLTNDSVARDLVIKAGEVFYQKCGGWIGKLNVSEIQVLFLYEGYQINPVLGYSRFSPIEVNALVRSNRGSIEIIGYENYVFEAEQKRLAQDAEEARRRAEQAARVAARQGRWNEFARKYGVQELVESKDLFSNPFLYQGKTVAVTLKFERMMTSSSAIFGGGNGIFVVSNIPTGTYRSKKDMSDVLAVKVLGMTEVKGLPFVSSMQVPHLRFIGVHFCKDYSCSDLLK